MNTITREFTKEQLIEHVEGVIHTFTEAVVLYPDNAGMKMDLLTAEIALAALKAKPVPGLFIKCTEIEPIPGKETITQATPMANGKYHESCFRLYAAPPALEPMKDHQIRELVNELRDIAAEYHGTQQLRERIARTVRTAMLQGAENAESRYTIQTAPALDSSPKNAESRCSNSPVIADGWVACSERMPDPDSKFRICVYTPTPHEDVRFRFVPASLFKSVCRDATHWKYMLPPAAPQQEVK